jgi:DNA-binding response OmpR family regulator
VIVRALLINDGEDVRMTTAWALSWEGFETAVVRLGREVPGMIMSFEPDVLILDFAEPEINGPMIAQLLRENWPSLPIILVASLNGHELHLPPRAELLPRPYSIEALVEAVVRLTYSPSSDL